MRNINITENVNGASIELKPEYVRYEFDSLEDAINALPNLPELCTQTADTASEDL